ncbi:MAG TPA: histidine--tRNA ligase [Candidatus Peribacterales bacterium]|nr:histidine--tRNA ligase [Candidatus Peribacterales bacterium]
MSQPLYRTPKGTYDILPELQQYHTYIKKAVRHRARQAGFKRIDTPIFENREVFDRGVGLHTDIVEKELFTVERRGTSASASASASAKATADTKASADRDIEKDAWALRPEPTAPICRAYIEHGMKELPQPVQLYVIGSMFRYDRPQKGRFREFHQFGFESIGISDPSIDAQLINVLSHILQDLQIFDRLKLQINNIGDAESRKAFTQALVDFFTGKERNLCEDCQSRLKTNPLRILDCKNEDCRILLKMAPKLVDYVAEESREFHKTLLEYLTEYQIPYEENPNLVRGLDYYNQTVFEFWDSSSGAQNSVAGGGRYDGLIELLGGQKTPAVGFGCGIERVIYHMKEAGVLAPMKDQVDVFVAQLGPEAKKKCLRLIEALRESGVHTIGALGEASLKSQMRLADKFQARYTLLLGQMEVKENKIILRDMKAGKQETMSFDQAIPKVIELLGGKDSLDTYTIKDKLGGYKQDVE